VWSHYPYKTFRPISHLLEEPPCGAGSVSGGRAKVEIQRYYRFAMGDELLRKMFNPFTPADCY
jgi:hypothetical protein